MKLAIFYHVAQLNQNKWKLVYQDQLYNILFSELYDNLSHFHIGINGNEKLPEILPKCNIVYNENKILEADTLKSLFNFCKKNNDYYVLYLHTKGVNWHNLEYEYNTQKWRQYLEYFTIWRWKNNISLLNDYDCVGTEFWPEAYLNKELVKDARHFAGNFWWARADYISKLDIDYLYNPLISDLHAQRWKSEFWIGTKNPRVYNYTNMVNQISDLYTKANYSMHTYLSLEKKMKNTGLNFQNGKLIIKKPKVMETASVVKKDKKFVMITMFKNEAHTIGRMLESCYKYIDYYIIQDNGSTDGTPEVVSNFFKDKNIPGFVYKCEEGWIGFGWNRDHLLQQCQQTDHGCDWILKMDCDEILEVDEDFDWSIFNDTSIQAFHVPNIRGGTIYNRAWIWNAKLQWRFNHDTSHETISLDTDGIGENFQRVNLPKSYRHISFNDGQSWTVSTKFLSDALILEEKMMREKTILQDHYHFWYIGKSYSDAYKIGDFPLERQHEEYARRAIWYFQKFLDVTHDFSKIGNAQRIDEMGYYSALLIAQAYEHLNNNNKKIEWLKNADAFCPRRNEHLVMLAETYHQLGKFHDMHEITKKLIQKERSNPFPNFMFIIDNNCYPDTGTYVNELHNIAVVKKEETKFIPNINLNLNNKRRLFVVDNFYENPDQVRNYALSLEYTKDLRWYKGLRSSTAYRTNEIKESFESIIGQSITNWDNHGFNGVFQITTAEDPQVYHYDSQKWAAMIYLTPNAPNKSGTRLHKSTITGCRNAEEENINDSFRYGFYDSTQFDTVDDVGNIYNRLVIMDARNIHSAGPYFGQDNLTGRLIHLFFFD